MERCRSRIMNSTTALPTPSLPPESTPTPTHHGIDIALLAILLVIPLGLFALYMVFGPCIVDKYRDMKLRQRRAEVERAKQRAIRLQYERYP